MIDKNMIKLAQIRNSYAMKQFGALSSGEKALLDYESLCLELMKENQQLKEVIEEVREYINNLGTQDGMLKDYKIDRFIKEDLLQILDKEKGK